MSFIGVTKFINSDYGVAAIATLWVKVSGLVARYHNFILVLDQTILKRYISSFENIEINLCKSSQCATHGHAFGLSAR